MYVFSRAQMKLDQITFRIALLQPELCHCKTLVCCLSSPGDLLISHAKRQRQIQYPDGDDFEPASLGDPKCPKLCNLHAQRPLGDRTHEGQ